MKKNRVEWTVFGLSSVVVVAVVGLLLYAQFTRSHNPPQLSVTFGDVRRHSGYYAVGLQVRNDGDITAEEVNVEVVLRMTEGQERSTVVLPFVPRGAQRIAWVTFRADPAEGTLQARVLGYHQP